MALTALGKARPGAALRQRRERVLILGTGPLADQVIHEIDQRPGSRAVVVGVLDDSVPVAGGPACGLFLGRMDQLPAIIDERRPTRILVALAERRNRTPMQALLESSIGRSITVEDAADYYEHLTGKLALESLLPMSVVLSGKLRHSVLQQTLMRILSLASALVALVACFPLLVVIALAIKLDSPGPVFFVQRRVGVGGRPFMLRKFRTMHAGSEARSEWEHDNRDRVTRVGKWLRAFRLDELPQFLNILRGEMNLVGPRPHPVSNLELFTLVARNLNEQTGAAISCYLLRTQVRPGLTGWAQVRYRYANNLEEEIEKLRYDLYYVKHMSPWLDFRILLETMKALCGHGLASFGRGRGAAATPPRNADSPTRPDMRGEIGRTREA
jgi:exopolysaccharide biosynthesis polyprenyl glycosylphosphotransferase